MGQEGETVSTLEADTRALVIPATALITAETRATMWTNVRTIPVELESASTVLEVMSASVSPVMHSMVNLVLTLMR